jgi:hypothetical protein
MLVDMEIAVRLDFQIQAPMASQQRQHVIEKSDAGRDLGTA